MLALSFMLYLTGIGGVAVVEAYKLRDSLRSRLSVVLIMNPELDSQRVEEVAKWLKATYPVVDIKHITKREGLNILRRAFPELDLSLLEDNPLFDVLILDLSPHAINIDTLSQMEHELEALAEVVDVVYEVWAVKVLDRYYEYFIGALVAVSLLMLVVTVLSVRGFVRLLLYEKRFLIKNMQAVGAGWWYIFKPFVGKALEQSVLALLIGGGLLAGSVYMLDRYGMMVVEELLRNPLIWWVGLLIILLVILVPVLTTLFTIIRYLKTSPEELYEI